MQYSKQYSEEVVKVADLTLSQCSIVLARQRHDYGIDQVLFAPQYPVFDQAPTWMTHLWTTSPLREFVARWTTGFTNWKNLEAVSRSINLQNTHYQRDEHPSNFRSFKEELAKVKELKLSLSLNMQEKKKMGCDEK